MGKGDGTSLGKAGSLLKNVELLPHYGCENADIDYVWKRRSKCSSCEFRAAISSVEKDRSRHDVNCLSGSTTWNLCSFISERPLAKIPRLGRSLFKGSTGQSSGKVKNSA